MALAIDALRSSWLSSCSSFSASQDVEAFTQAAKPSSRTGGVSKGSRLVVRAAGSKKKRSGVEHHRDGSSRPELPPKFGLNWLETGDELTGLKMEELVRGGHGVLFGSRIPKHYFMVKGFGQTDQGDGSDPWETGSYDLALEDAGDLSHHLCSCLRFLLCCCDPILTIEVEECNFHIVRTILPFKDIAPSVPSYGCR